MTRPSLVAVCLLLLLSFGAPARAESRPSLGVRLALEGRCEAALPELEAELAGPEPSAEAAWRLGQCALRAEDFPRAAEALGQAVARDPGNDEARLDWARALYHAGRAEEADAALSGGEPLADRALWQLYRGLVDLELGHAEAAVASLRRAVELDAAWKTGANPEPVEPMASFYLGVAFERAGQTEQAEDTLRRVAEVWEGTGWGDEASRSVRRAARRKAFFTLGVGAEYDDNVVLSGTSLPLAVSDTQSGRAIWQARGGVELWRGSRTAAGALASYRGRSHFDGDVRELDDHYPSATLWVEHAFSSRTRLRGSYDFAYYWLDEKSFAVGNAGRMALLHAWTPRQTSALYGRVFGENYLQSVSDEPLTATVDESERDPDGWGGSVGLAHAVALPLDIPGLGPPALRGGYFFTRRNAQGDEYAYDGHRLFAGLDLPLPCDATLQLEGSYEYRGYDHPSSFLQNDGAAQSSDQRQDILALGSRVEVPIAGPLSVALHYRYRYNRSNADFFDYDQHVVGGTLNLSYEVTR